MTTHQSPTRRRPRPWLLIEAALLVGFLAAWLLWPDDAPARVQWRSGASGSPVEPMATVPAEMPLQLELEIDRPMHAYVASHDVIRGTIALFPSTMLRSTLPPNPLPAGRHQLPGTHEGLALQWHAGDGVGATSFLVIASERPLADLASVLLTCRQMGNAAFPKRPILGTYAPTAGMDATPPRHELPDPVLRAAFALLDPLHDGPMQPLEGHPGVFAKVLRISTTPAGPAVDEDAVRAAVRQDLAPLDGVFGPEPAPTGR